MAMKMDKKTGRALAKVIAENEWMYLRTTAELKDGMIRQVVFDVCIDPILVIPKKGVKN